MHGWLRLAAALGVAVLPLLAPGNAQADDYAGDIRATFGRWVDAQGQAVTSLKPGGRVAAEYTIKNSRSYPVVITGMDSQVQASDCKADVTRLSNKLDPKGLFPLRLAPGQVSSVLTDESYVMAATSRCAAVSLTWYPNVTAEHQTAEPSSGPASTGQPTPRASPPVVTVEVTETAVPDPGAGAPRRRDPTPFIIVSAVVVATVLLGIVGTMAGRRPGRKWDE